MIKFFHVMAFGFACVGGLFTLAALQYKTDLQVISSVICFGFAAIAIGFAAIIKEMRESRFESKYDKRMIDGPRTAK